MSDSPTPIHAASLDIEEALVSNLEWAKRVALGMVNDSERAKDLVQEAMRRGLENPPADLTRIRPWIARVMRNLLHMGFRTAQRRDAREEFVARDATAEGHAQELFERAEAQTALSNEVVKLSDDLKLVLLAHYWEEMSLSEIGERHNISPRTVEARLRKARQLLRQRLDRKFGGEGTWLNAMMPLVLWKPPAKAALPTAATIAVAATVIGGVILSYQYLFAPAKVDVTESKAVVSEMETATQDTSKDRPLEQDRVEIPIATTDAPSRTAKFLLFDPDGMANFENAAVDLLHIRHATQDEIATSPKDELIKGPRITWQVVKRERVHADSSGLVQTEVDPQATRVEIPIDFGTLTHSLQKISPPKVRRSGPGAADRKALPIPMFARSGLATGIVVDTDGKPVSNAQVAYSVGIPRGIYNDPIVAIDTLPDGSFHLPNVLGKRDGFTIWAKAPNMYPTAVYRGWQRRGPDFHNIELILAPAVEPTFHLTDPEGNPVEGARMECLGTHKKQHSDLQTGHYHPLGLQIVATDENGSAFLGKTVDGARVLIRHKDFQLQTVILKAGQSDYSLILKPGLNQKGLVVDHEGAPVQDATITVLWGIEFIHTVTDASGNFSLVQLPVDAELQVQVGKVGFGREFLTVKNANQLATDPIELNPGQTISGQLVLHPDMIPTADLLGCDFVSYEEFPLYSPHFEVPVESVTVNRDGSFQIRDLAEGRYLLTYEADFANIRSAFVDAGATNVRLEPLGPTTSGGKITIHQPESHGKPEVLRAVIQRNMPEGSGSDRSRIRKSWMIETTTDFYLPELPSGSYSVDFTDVQHKLRAVVNLAVQEGQRIEKEYVLVPNHTFRLKVLDVGTPVEYVAVSAMDTDKQRLPTWYPAGRDALRLIQQTDADGYVVLQGMPVGAKIGVSLTNPADGQIHLIEIDELPLEHKDRLTYDFSTASVGIEDDGN